MTKSRVMIAVFLLWPVLLPGPAQARQPVALQEHVKLPTEKFVLDNGLTVLWTDMPSSEVVSVFALVKTGSAVEDPFLGSGLTHFLEHMLFKGTQRRKVGEIAQEILAQGGVINASTSFDFTIYTITLPAQGFAVATDVLADMLTYAQFDPQELERERQVVFREMNLRNDIPEYYLSLKIFETAFLRHPYRLPIIGFHDLLDQITREDFLQYYRNRYIPNNIVLSIAGGVNRQEVLDNVEQAFGPIPRGPEFTRNIPQDPPQLTPRRREVIYPTDVTRMSVVYKGASLTSADMPALDVLSMIMGRGESSRLYTEIFKKQRLVESISANHYTPVDAGLFEIESTLKTENVDKALAAIEQQIQWIQRKGVHKKELEKTKTQALSQYIAGLQKTSSVAYQTALDEAFLGDYAFSRKYVDLIQSLTVADIQRVARTYLIPNRQSVVIMKNEAEAQEEKTQSADLAQDIKKVTLDNGVRLVLRENHQLPRVTVSAVLSGGTRYENEALNGLSELTARLWVKGTRKRRANRIAQEVESRGAGLSSFSGRNSFGIRMGFLSQDVDFGLDLLTEVLKYPAFPKDELEKERGKILNAIRKRQDSIGAVTMKTLREGLFSDHPIRLEVLGTEVSVQGITTDEIRSFYRQLFSAKNLVISVFGDFDSEVMVRQLQRRLAKLPKHDVPVPLFEPEPIATSVTVRQQMPKEQALVMFGFQGAEVYHPDRYGLEVLTELLGSAFNGRMFMKIREEMGAAYTLGARYIPARDTGILHFQAATAEENVDDVKAAIADIIRDVQDQGIQEQELQDLKNYLKGSFLMGLETDWQLSFMTALDELYGLGYDYYQQVPDLIDRVTTGDVQRLANEYLDLNQSNVVITLPVQEPQGQAQ